MLQPTWGTPMAEEPQGLLPWATNGEHLDALPHRPTRCLALHSRMAVKMSFQYILPYITGRNFGRDQNVAAPATPSS